MPFVKGKDAEKKLEPPVPPSEPVKASEDSTTTIVPPAEGSVLNSMAKLGE